MNHTLKRLFAAAAITAVSLSLYAPMLTLPVQAEDTATLTVENPMKNETYSFHQMLILESQSADGSSLSYVAHPFWAEFFQKRVPTKTYANYFQIDEEGSSIVHVRFNTPDGSDPLIYDSDEMKQFAFDAREYMYANAPFRKPEYTTTATDGDNPSAPAITMDKGYYLMLSSVGDNISTVNVNDAIETVQEKNEGPFIEKYVMEDSTSEYGKENDAQIGDIITFKVIMTAVSGQVKFKVHDMIDDGLKLKEIQSVKHFRSGTLVKELTEREYISHFDIKGHQDFNYSEVAGCDFEVEVVHPYNLTDMQPQDKVEIIYTAELTKDAVINTAIKNRAVLQYSEVGFTEFQETVTKTWGFTINKVDGDTGEKLAGASFVLKNAADEFLKVEEVPNTSAAADNEPVSYTVLGTTADESEGVMTTNASGQIIVLGLDSETYSLVEVAAPAGYNRLDDPQPVTINPASSSDLTEYTTTKIENFTGIEMPGTGGSGTTLIYAAGTAFIALSGGLFVLKRRKEAHE